MQHIITRPLSMKDIPTWLALSNEYDNYVRELVSDLTLWYEGNNSDIAFLDYMKAKISQREACIALDEETKKNIGIVAFSKKNNKISFFGVAHGVDFHSAGDILISYAINQLNDQLDISITVLKSKSPHLEKERDLLKNHGFTCVGSELENGVPVETFVKRHGAL